MGRYDGLKTGREIARKVREDLARSGVVMDLYRGYTQYPDEYRRQVLAEQTRAARETLAEGRAAMANWADAARDDAKRRMSVAGVGTQAEETRRLTVETRIGRLVQLGQQNPKGTAADLAEKADRAYVLGDLDEAEAFSMAAIELAGPAAPRLAVETAALVEYDRISADPDRAKARRELAEAEVQAAIFDRDIAGEHSRVLQDAARLAAALGDDQAAAVAAREATRESIAAKTRAFAIAQETGEAYQEPLGVLPGGPTDLNGTPPGATLPPHRGGQ